MKFAYLVKAHKNPAQVRRMISRFYFPGAAFYLTIDKRSDFRAFQREMRKLDSNIPCFWVSPLRDGTWSGSGLVLSSLDALKTILKQEASPQQIFQISGQCYPIKPIQRLVDYFSSLGNRFVMKCTPPPVPSWGDGGWRRLDHYHYILPRWMPFDKGWREYPEEARHQTLKSRMLNAFLKRKFPLPRIHPAYVQHYFGHAFWSLTPDAAEYVLSFHQAHPDFFRHHRYTFALDEYFFQTIVGSSAKWSQRITQTRQHYCDWSAPIRPAVLTMAHRDALQKTNCLVARKFDDTVDAKILDWIDENLLEK